MHALYLPGDNAALPLVNQVRFLTSDGPTSLAVDVSLSALTFTSGASSLRLPAQKIYHRFQVFFAGFVGRYRGNSAVMQCKSRSAHQLPNDPGVSQPALLTRGRAKASASHRPSAGDGIFNTGQRIVNETTHAGWILWD